MCVCNFHIELVRLFPSGKRIIRIFDFVICLLFYGCPGVVYLCGLSAMRTFLFTSLFHFSFLNFLTLFFSSSFSFSLLFQPILHDYQTKVAHEKKYINRLTCRSLHSACSERRRETGRDRGRSFFLSPRPVYLPTSANIFCILCIPPQSCLVQCKLNWL